jgi:hypothetical protein
MRQPLVRNNDLAMAPQSALDPPALPIPKYHVPFSVSGRHPPSIGREPDLAGVPGCGVSGEALFAVLTEVVGGVDEDLVVEGLGGEPFF